MKEKPTRCIDSVMKYCLECPYGVVTYPDYPDTDFFNTECMFGFDQGRAEDEPTTKELEEFRKWSDHK